MLRRAQLAHGQDFAFPQLRERSLFFLLACVGRGIVHLGFLVEGQKTVELENRSRRLEFDAAGINFDIGLVENSRVHLRGDKPAPDQPVKLQ